MPKSLHNSHVTQLLFSQPLTTKAEELASHYKSHSRSPGEVYLNIFRTIHLVSGQAPKKSLETPSNTRLTLGDYIADILLDTRHHARIFHWIVQRMGSAEILQWGQEYSFEEAQREAQSCLESYIDRDQLKQA